MELNEAPKRLALLGGFVATVGGAAVRLPASAQRVVAFVAVQGRPVLRRVAATALWPHVRARVAEGNLRSAIYRVRRGSGGALLETTSTHVSLAADVLLDLHEAVAATRRESATCPYELITLLRLPLLPDWSEEWLTFEQERWEQLRIHGLESLAASLLDAGMVIAAIEAALAASSVDPFRETPHRLVVRAHLAEGNRSSALAHYARYRKFVERELGIAPSDELRRLVADVAGEGVVDLWRRVGL